MRPLLLSVSTFVYTLFAFTIFIAVLFALPVQAEQVRTHATETVNRSADTSVAFIENVGQWRDGALYQSQWQGATLFLAKDALWFSYLDTPARDYPPFDPLTGATNDPPPRGGVHLRLSFVGANPNPTIEPFTPLTTSVTYLHGNDPTDWRSQVPLWGGVRYHELYPGVDLELLGIAGQLRPRLVIDEHEQVNLAQIRLQIEGAEQLILQPGGLVAASATGSLYPLPLFELVLLPATIKAGSIPRIEGQVVQSPFQSQTTSYTSEPVSPSPPSNLIYATFLGGSDYDYGTRITRDASGAVYVGGTTESFDFPTTPGTFDPTPEPSEYRIQAFVTKLNPTGTDLVYSTFIDGNNSDYVYGIAVDGSGAVYLAGETRSSNFPTTPDAPTPGFGGRVDGYALKISPSGSTLDYGMYLGGAEQDYARDLALGTDGSVVVASTTRSPNFPTTPDAYDPTVNDFDIFVTRINPDGTELIYSTALGGMVKEQAFSVALDQSNAAYVLGRTESNDYPTTPGALDTTPAIGNLVVTKLAPMGDDLAYSTAIDGRVNYWAGAIAVDATGAAYFTSEAVLNGFPVTPDAYDTTCGITEGSCDGQGHSDGVLIKLNPAGSDVIYGTYFGGGLNEWGHEVQIDAQGNAYVIGRSDSADFPVTPGSYTVASPYLSPFIIAKFNPTATELLHLTRTPGAVGQSIHVTQEDIVWYVGSVEPDYYTYETTPGAYDTTYNGNRDGAVGRLVLPKAATVTEVDSSGGVALSTIDTFSATTTFAADTFTATAVFTHAPRHPLSLPPISPFVETIGDPFVHYATIEGEETTPRQPYTLALTVPPSFTDALLLYVWDGTAWQPDTTATYDPATRTLTVTRSAFGWFFLAATDPAPNPPPRSLFLPLIYK